MIPKIALLPGVTGFSLLTRRSVEASTGLPKLWGKFFKRCDVLPVHTRKPQVCVNVLKFSEVWGALWRRLQGSLHPSG